MKDNRLKKIYEKAIKIKLLLLDVDGVMTDGGLYFDDQGNETKKFNVKDGLGIRLLQKAGIKTGILSGRKSAIVDYRAKNLGINLVYHGYTHKFPIFMEILDKLGIEPFEVCFIGDDILDIPLLQTVGLGVAVHDAHDDAGLAADYITKKSGGNGAIREICDIILKAQGHYEMILSDHEIKLENNDNV